ncbi:MAG: MmgE/PrpD family protein [Microbacterium sp.]|uniref:MmgE/PrpD family protein n=1 Tax=Microbacterium sp. TaxID=51671 RepID=UPI003F9DE0F1
MSSENQSSNPETELLQWAANLASRDIGEFPAEAVAAAITIVCDDFAAIIAAQAEPEIKKLIRRADDRSSATNTEATVIGSGRKTDVLSAAQANAISANWTELDGGFRLATCHGSLYSLPSALAEVEARDGTLGDLLRGLIIGYEVVTRIAQAYRPALPLNRHPHASLSPIASAAAIAAVRNLEPNQFKTAVLSAASMSMVGPFSHAKEGATIRNAWVAGAVSLGYLSVDMTELGLTAGEHVLHEIFAIADNPSVDKSALTRDLGERFGVQDGYQKAYACCQYLHSSVESAKSISEMMKRDGKIAEQIIRIEVATHPLAVALDERNPATTLAGRFSLPHAISTVVANGHAGVTAFAADALQTPEMQRLRPLVEISDWSGTLEPPSDRPSQVTVHFDDGSVLSAEVLSAVGGPDRPLTTEQLSTKFHDLTERYVPGYSERATVWLKAQTRPDFDMKLRDALVYLLGERE